MRGGRPTSLALAVACLAVASPGARSPAAALQESRQERTVLSIEIEGNDRYTDSQIASALGQSVGEPLLPEPELSKGIEVLFDTFRVRVLDLDVVENDGGVVLKLRVEELPLDLEVRFVGNVDISTDTLREWAGLGDGEELYLYQAPAVRSRLLRHYKDEGYYFCRIDVVERDVGADASGESVAPDVIFRIQEGPEVKVRRVDI